MVIFYQSVLLDGLFVSRVHEHLKGLETTVTTFCLVLWSDPLTSELFFEFQVFTTYLHPKYEQEVFPFYPLELHTKKLLTGPQWSPKDLKLEFSLFSPLLKVEHRTWTIFFERWTICILIIIKTFYVRDN